MPSNLQTAVIKLIWSHLQTRYPDVKQELFFEKRPPKKNKQVSNTLLTSIVHIDSSGLQSSPPKLLCLKRTNHGYAFRVRVKDLLRFGLRLGIRLRSKVLKGHCLCVLEV